MNLNRLLLFDVPLDLKESIKGKVAYPLIDFNGKLSNERLNSSSSLESEWLFWQLGQTRKDQMKSKLFSQEMILTLNLLIGGTPIILYGEEINLNQVNIY